MHQDLVCFVFYHMIQGRSQNLKEVLQNSRKFFTLITSQLMTYKKKPTSQREKNLSSIVITDVKLAS